MLTVIDSGANNCVDISDETLEDLNGTLELAGEGNVVRIGPGSRSSADFHVHLGDRCTLQVDERVVLGHLYLHAAADAQVSIGSDSGFNGVVRLLLHEASSIRIGHACLFAGGVDVTVSDMHSIVETKSGVRINPPEDVGIGNHVWIAQNSQILKGANIGDGAVVGAGSIVRGSLDPYSIYAGVPARKIRSNATWDFRLLPFDRDYVPLDARYRGEGQLAAAVRHGWPRRLRAAWHSLRGR